MEALYRLPEYAGLGPVFRSSPLAPLTESELEYLVSVTKHVFEGGVVFDFTVTNTVPDVRLVNVSVHLTAPADAAGAWRPLGTVAASSVVAGKPAHCYVGFAREPEAGYPSCTWAAELRGGSEEADGSAGADLEFPLSDVEVGTCDYVAPRFVPDFRAAWEATDKDTEALQGFALPAPSLDGAFKAVVAALGLAPQDGTGVVKPGVPKHNAYLAGLFVGGLPLLARLQLAAEGGKVTLKIAVRSPDRDLSQLIVDAVQ
jgi:coatomer protein complex subunit gamma